MSPQLLTTILNIIDAVAAIANTAPKVREDIDLIKKIVSENREPSDEEWATLNDEIEKKSEEFGDGIIPPAPETKDPPAPEPVDPPAPGIGDDANPGNAD